MLVELCDLGALDFNMVQQHLHTGIHFGLHLQQRRKEMCVRAHCHRRKKHRDNKECNNTVTKHLRLVFPPSLGFCLSFSSFDAFPWEQWDRAGRCCCPWCRNNQTEQRGFLLCLSSPSTPRLYLCPHVTLQTDNTAHNFTITHKQNIMHFKVEFRCRLFAQAQTYLPYPSLTDLKRKWTEPGVLHTNVAWKSLYSKRATVPARDLKSHGIICIRQLYRFRLFRTCKVTQSCRDPICESLRVSQCHLEPFWTPWQSGVVQHYSSSSCGQEPLTSQ